MNKKKKSGFKKFLGFILFIVVLLFIIFFLCTYVFDVKISTVVIHDNDILSDEEVINLAFNDDYHSNFFLTNSSKIEKKILKNSFVKDVDVKKNLFLEVHIYLKEKKPLFLREDNDKIVFDDGSSLKNSDSYQLNIPFLINYVPDKKYNSLIKKLCLIDYSVIQKISEIKYYPNKYDEDRFILYMNDSNKVYINLPKFKNLNKYNDMVEKFEGKKGTLYLDSGNYFKVEK